MQAHTLETRESGRVWCSTCERGFAAPPGATCPGVKVYQWEPWPDSLFTERQIRDAGLIPGVPRGAIWMAKHNKWLYLYRKDEATTRERTAAQIEAAKRRGETLRMGWTCIRCGETLRDYVKGGGLCRTCEHREKARGESVQWAQTLLEFGFVVLDTETTGLNQDRDDEAVQIAVLKHDGTVLLDTLVKPTIPMSEGAAAVHGITDAMLEHAPTFHSLLLPLQAAITEQVLVIYNADFDMGILANMFWSIGIREHAPNVLNYIALEDAMLEYARFVGDWSNYHNDFYWQKLPGGDHTALGDCRAVLRLIQAVAAES